MSIASFIKGLRYDLNRIIKRKPGWDFERCYCSALDKNTEKKTKNEVEMPPEPTYCCMTGCANCVWLKYAQELTQLYDNGDEIAKSKIKEKVPDPIIRAYLFTQLGIKENDE